MTAMLDDLLLGDPARRLLIGLLLLALGAASLAWLAWHVRRRGEVYLDHHVVYAVGLIAAPSGIAIALSAPWGPIGAAVFVVVAIVVCGVGAAAMLLRRGA
jgi:hypothetical protein